MTDPGKSEAPVAHDNSRLPRGNESPDYYSGGVPVAERVFEATRVRLSSVLGAGGYATLFARALTLTRPDFPWMGGVVPDKTGSLTGRFPVTNETDPMESARGYAALLTQFAALLETFIGRELTDRLLDAVWRDLEEDPTENDGAGASSGRKNL